MSIVRVPTPLRPYTQGQKEIEVPSATVGEALRQLSERFPALEPHLFNEQGQLRPYVSVFVNDEDMHSHQGEATLIQDKDRVMIIPSIAGGNGSEALRAVDHAALRTNQAFIISLLLLAFVGDLAWIVAGVGGVMLAGSILGRPGFVPAYLLLRRLRVVRPDLINDHPQPHRFAQTLGGVFLAVGALLLYAGSPFLGWVLSWVVIALAALNLFGGFCVGCALYYWLSRLGVPGFHQSPPPGSFPGRRPATGG